MHHKNDIPHLTISDSESKHLLIGMLINTITAYKKTVSSICNGRYLCMSVFSNFFFFDSPFVFDILFSL